MIKLLLILLLISTITCEDIPQQIHIAYAGVDMDGNSDGMRISWQTQQQTTTSTVKYGLEKGQYLYTATGEQSTYYETFDHHVLLPGLQSSTRYYYICGDEKSGFSEEFSFISAPSLDDFEYPINIAIIGDMGMYNSDHTFDRLRKLKDQDAYDFIWHVGDISYADDAFLHHPLEFYYEDTWNTYMNQMQDIVAEIPYMVCPGNHEAECHSPVCQFSPEKLKAFSNFTAYNNRFKMPYEESNGALNMWYSFNYGPIHLTNFDTETDFDGADGDHYTIFGDGNGGFGDQVDWIANDLKNAAMKRQQFPWMLAAAHRPMYSIEEVDVDGDPTGGAANIQSVFEPLFHENDLDVFFAGHRHAAERTSPIYNSEIQGDDNDAKGTIHIVQGAGGNTEGLSNYAGYPIPIWNEWYDTSEWGVGIFTLHSDDICEWTFYAAESGAIMDQVKITRNRS